MSWEFFVSHFRKKPKPAAIPSLFTTWRMGLTTTASSHPKTRGRMIPFQKYHSYGEADLPAVVCQLMCLHPCYTADNSSIRAHRCRTITRPASPRKHLFGRRAILLLIADSMSLIRLIHASSDGRQHIQDRTAKAPRPYPCCTGPGVRERGR